jgi:hypothetical protein
MYVHMHLHVHVQLLCVTNAVLKFHCQSYVLILPLQGRGDDLLHVLVGDRARPAGRGSSLRPSRNRDRHLPGPDGTTAGEFHRRVGRVPGTFTMHVAVCRRSLFASPPRTMRDYHIGMPHCCESFLRFELRQPPGHLRPERGEQCGVPVCGPQGLPTRSLPID